MMKEGFESLGRVRLTGFVLLAVAFLVGVLAGAAGERLRAGRVPERSEWRPRPGRLPPPLERLDLTRAQREEIGDILEQARPRTDAVLEITMPRLRAIMDSTHQAIREVLTPEQREQLDEELPRRGRFDRPFRQGPRRPPPDRMPR